VNLDPEGSHLELNFTLGDKRGQGLRLRHPCTFHGHSSRMRSIIARLAKRKKSKKSAKDLQLSFYL
jgi:hypothetical protein